MHDLLTVAVMVLATWRLSSLLVDEDGPFNLLRKVRKWAGAGEFSPRGLDAERLTPQEIEEVMLRAGRPESFLAGLLSCIWCTSIWVAAGWVILFALTPYAYYPALVCALSAAAIMVRRLT